MFKCSSVTLISKLFLIKIKIEKTLKLSSFILTLRRYDMSSKIEKKHKKSKKTEPNVSDIDKELEKIQKPRF